MNNNDNSYPNPWTTWHGHKINKILCFGDSNTWGHDPLTDQQLKNPWPRLLQAQLPQFEFIIDGMPGRTTRFDLPELGLTSGESSFYSHRSDNTLLLLMLGTNDLCRTLDLTAAQIADSLNTLIKAWPPEQLLLIAPAPLTDLAPRWTPYFANRQTESLQFACHYQKLARETGCSFIDAAQYCQTGEDGLHLNASGHQALAGALLAHLQQSV